MSSRMVIRLGVLVVSSSVLGLRPAPAAPVPRLTLEEVLAHFGFEEAARGEVLAGAIVSTELETRSDKELAVAAVMLVPGGLEEVFAACRDGLGIAVNPDVLAHGRIAAAPADESDFATVRFTPAEVDEVKDLLDVEPGDDFNLSRAEIDRLAKVGAEHRGRRARKSAAAREAVAATYREILRGRLEAYRREGLDGVVRYERDDDGEDPARPGRELRASASSARLLARHNPTLHRTFARYPRDGADDVEHRFDWVKQTVDDRPAFILSHQLSRRTPESAVIAARQFYVGHTYNSLQAVTGFIPLEDGTVIYYVNRTSTDRVAGLRRPVAHRVGRGRMRDAVEAHLAALREALTAQGRARRRGDLQTKSSARAPYSLSRHNQRKQEREKP